MAVKLTGLSHAKAQNRKCNNCAYADLTGSPRGSPKGMTHL